MPNPVSSTNKVELVSDLAAAEREVEGYLSRLAQAGGQPDSCLPFALDKPAATAAWTKWLGGLSMVPGDLTRTAELGTLKQVYVPFWVVNSMTYTKYQGEKGEEYQDTEYYTDASGSQASRQVAKVGWSYAEGEVKHNFENLTLCGVSGLPDLHLALLTPRELKSAQPFGGVNGEVTVQRSALDPKGAFNKARTQMEGTIRKLTEQDIGGKQQKVNKLETRHVGVSLKQILVPVWEGSYRYKGKDYKVLIHGASGEATGEQPISAGKILLVIFIFLAVVAAIGAAVWFLLSGPFHK